MPKGKEAHLLQYGLFLFSCYLLIIWPVILIFSWHISYVLLPGRWKIGRPPLNLNWIFTIRYSARPEGSNYRLRAPVLVYTYMIAVVFAFLMDFKKWENNILRQVQIIWNSNFSVHRKSFLKHYHIHLFMYDLRVLFTIMAKLCSWMEMVCPPKPEIFIVWLFTEKVRRSLC